MVFCFHDWFMPYLSCTRFDAVSLFNFSSLLIIRFKNWSLIVTNNLSVQLFAWIIFVIMYFIFFIKSILTKFQREPHGFPSKQFEILDETEQRIITPSSTICKIFHVFIHNTQQCMRENCSTRVRKFISSTNKLQGAPLELLLVEEYLNEWNCWMLVS